MWKYLRKYTEIKIKCYKMYAYANVKEKCLLTFYTYIHMTTNVGKYLKGNSRNNIASKWKKIENSNTRVKKK